VGIQIVHHQADLGGFGVAYVNAHESISAMTAQRAFVIACFARTFRVLHVTVVGLLSKLRRDRLLLIRSRAALRQLERS
jgi:hypothetical protein